ncbi:hypothetical protein CHS0354_021492 [Potamilus streckersoni]|uniref:Phosphodiesterase n=1 Tax=Potamilus streckersoni TaxID=2493646 RepID=A0AAE0SAW2_9BIVA|nr:hypothetical protein CHS0354_021492 [Potamilus streckersoni]
MGNCNCTRHSNNEDLQQQNTGSEVQFGPLQLKQKTMSVLLVFSREDAQSDGFWWAAERGGYKCNLAKSHDGALECFLDKQQEVVIIDHRHNKSFDAEALCRSIRATKASEHTVIVAVTKKYPLDKEEPSILPLLKIGFNRKYSENANIGACFNELLTIEHGEVKSRSKLSACNALLTALDNVQDAVEITDEEHIIEYVNPAYERLTGFSCEESIGKMTRDFRSEKNKPDLQEIINGYLKKGKYWEGTYYTRRKSGGEAIPHHCHIRPVTASGGKISHYVSVRSSQLDTSHLYERLKDSEFYNQIANGGLHGMIPRRRESVSRIHSMMIEAPITKVINIINAAQENSSITVAQALDKVLDILRSSELYSPYFAQQMKDDDPMTSDYLGGLVSQDVKRHLNPQDVHNPSSKSAHHPSSPHIPSSLSADTFMTTIPENIQNALLKEPAWDIDIFQLEKVTSKRTLVYLGMKTLMRFGVCQYLNISETCLLNWLQMIESNYHSSNTYHNSTHAADVLHCTAYFLDKQKIKAVFDEVDAIASLIAAVIHDVDHPGRTNAFLINSNTDLALLYNDLAVLESHHAALAFQLTQRDEKVNIFKNLEREDYRILRHSVIDMVLATEMKQHFEHLNKFINSINKLSQKADETSSVSGSGSPDSTVILSQLSTPENKMLIKRMLIKCADVSNPLRPLELCVEWAKRIAEEYIQQTDEEKKGGLPVVMPVFDRKTYSLPKSQTSFIDVFINDMFDAWDYFCEIQELMTYLQNNYQYWKELEQKEQEMKDKNSKNDEACDGLQGQK